MIKVPFLSLKDVTAKYADEIHEEVAIEGSFF